MVSLGARDEDDFPNHAIFVPHPIEYDGNGLGFLRLSFFALRSHGRDRQWNHYKTSSETYTYFLSYVLLLSYL